MNKAIILAGGGGSRFLSKTPKQFLKINNKTLVNHLIEACIFSKSIDSVLVVCNGNYVSKLKSQISKIYKKNQKKIEIISGGGSRLESTLFGFDYIDIHVNDSVILLETSRPFVKAKHIDLIYSNFFIKGVDCAFYYSMVKESLFYFKSENDIINLNRSSFFLSQTPYVFNYESVKEISFYLKKGKMSDDKDIISFLPSSKNKLAILSEFNNIKITFPEDLLLAENLIKKENEK